MISAAMTFAQKARRRNADIYRILPITGERKFTYPLELARHAACQQSTYPRPAFRQMCFLHLFARFDDRMARLTRIDRDFLLAMMPAI